MLPFDLDRDDAEHMEVFHEQTRNHRGAMGRRNRIIGRYLHDPRVVHLSTQGWDLLAGDRLVTLPETDLPTSAFTEVCEARQSTRRAQIEGAITLAELSALLAIAVRSVRFGVPKAAPDTKVHFRPYPSPGGLYPCELFIIPSAVDGLVDRPYRYDAVRHALIDFGGQRGRFQAVETDNCPNPPPIAFVIVGVLDRATGKYGPRGYRLACLEAGHLGQNLVLAATALGLPNLVYASYFDAEIEQWLGMDGLNEVVLSTILLGGKHA